MREQLTKYVDLLFAGAPGAVDIKSEILQNTLDRYDDLISQGKTPQAAYSLAISGIGDISELISTSDSVQTVTAPETHSLQQPAEEKPLWKKVLRAVGIFLYIICPMPLFILSEIGMDTIGLCGTLGIVAIATVLMILSSGKASAATETSVQKSEESDLRKAVNSIIFAVGLCGYFMISFASGAWHITWIMFLIIAAAQGLAKACVDLKEAK